MRNLPPRLVLLAWILGVQSLFADSVTFTVSMGGLADAQGNPASPGMLCQLIDLGEDGIFDPVLAGAWVSGDDTLIAQQFINEDAWPSTGSFDVTDGPGTAGLLSRLFNLTLDDTLAEGRKVGLRWFPSLTAMKDKLEPPVAGVAYGEFTRQSAPLHGGVAWIVPAAASVVAFDPMITTGFTAAPGQDAVAAGLASHTVLEGYKVSPAVKVVVTSPKKTVGSLFDIEGLILDDVAIDHVELTLNGGMVLKVGVVVGSDGKARFVFRGLIAQIGVNIVTIQAFDVNHRASKITTLSLTYSNQRPALAGRYRGLLLPFGTPKNELIGSLIFDVTSSGAFSGKLVVGLSTLTVKGQIGDDLIARFGANRRDSFLIPGSAKGQPPLGRLAFAFAADTGSGVTADGTLVADDGSEIELSALTIRRDYFNGKTAATTVPAEYLKNKGAFTVVLPSKPQPDALSNAVWPQGDGFANVSVTKQGSVKLAGRLADGTALSSAGNLSKDLKWPCFAKLYAKAGALAGEVAFDRTAASSDFQGLDLIWICPPLPSARYYPQGWPRGVVIDLRGAAFEQPAAAAKRSVFPGLHDVDLQNGNAQIEFSQGKLTPPGTLFTKSMNIAPSNLVRTLADDKSFKVTIKASTGSIGGRFRHTDGSDVKFSGIIYQKGSVAGAHGFFLSTVPKGATATGESGKVKVLAK